MARQLGIQTWCCIWFGAFERVGSPLDGLVLGIFIVRMSSIPWTTRTHEPPLELAHCRHASYTITIHFGSISPRAIRHIVLPFIRLSSSRSRFLQRPIGALRMHDRAKLCDCARRFHWMWQVVENQQTNHITSVELVSNQCRKQCQISSTCVY